MNQEAWGPQEEYYTPRARAKASLINEILHEEDLYRVLGASRNASSQELRRCYLERSKICHPDKPPFHPQSTSAFQKVGFSYDVLKSPSSRRTYDRALGPSISGNHDRTAFLNGEQTFRGAVEAILKEFMEGDFTLVRKLLESLNKSYPNLVSMEVISAIEGAFFKIRELVITTRVYAFLISIELGRIHRVQKRLMALGYFDVLGRMQVTMQLVRVTLAVPMRVDRALRQREEREWRARTAGWNAAGVENTKLRGGILNERVLRVLEFIVGSSADDEAEDLLWASSKDPALNAPKPL